MPFDPTFLSNFLLVLTAFGGAFLAALWIALVIWTYRDIRARARDPLVQILSALLVAVLNLPGVLVYLILRPARTLEEEYQHTLEEESLLQALEELPLCPGCERRVKDDWQVCPNCHTKLKKTCHHCGKLMELPWNICPVLRHTRPRDAAGGTSASPARNHRHGRCSACTADRRTGFRDEERLARIRTLSAN